MVPETPGINRWIFIPPKERQGAEPDAYIYCQIHKHPIKDGKGQAKILKVLGKAGDTGIERALTVATFHLPDTWPDAVQKQASALDESTVEARSEGRDDRTDQPYVTIDSPGTQDMDDALAGRAQRHWLETVHCHCRPDGCYRAGQPCRAGGLPPRHRHLFSRRTRCPCCRIPSVPACAR